MAKQVSELTERKDAAALLELMKDNGVTQADIDAVDARVKAQIENGELSEEMLEEVAGGVAPVIRIGEGIGEGIVAGAKVVVDAWVALAETIGGKVIENWA